MFLAPHFLDINCYNYLPFPTMQHNLLFSTFSSSLGMKRKQILNTGNLKFTPMRRKYQTGSTKLRRKNCLLFYIPPKEQKLEKEWTSGFPQRKQQTRSQFRYQSCRPPASIIHHSSFSLFQSFVATNNGAVERMFRTRLLLVTVSCAT